MARPAYLDLAHGAGGDMIIAALAHAGRRLGIDVESRVADAVASLPLGCSVTFVDDERSGIVCLRAEVKTDTERHSGAALRDALERADVGEAIRARALAGLDAIVRAEAAVHGTDERDVHLHELGSADTAADLIGAATAIAALDIDRLSSAPVPVPRGWIRAGHGSLPAAAPATLEIVTGHPVRVVDEDGELLTPTAAAILTGHSADIGGTPDLVLAAVGTGAGTRDTGIPNITRVFVGDANPSEPAHADSVVLLETNIDDQSPQGVAHAAEAALREGALDAWVTPVVMKKSRPGLVLSVLARPADEARLVRLLFRETTTLGIRRRPTTRWALERDEVLVDVDGTTVRVKIARLDGEVVNIAPEFDDCAAAGGRSGLPFEQVRTLATDAARAALRSYTDHLSAPRGGER